MTKEISPLVQKWVGSNLPQEHVYPAQGVHENLLASTKRWVVQPAKRHVAHWYAQYLSQSGTEIIGITGSAGKTTTKEMLASVLSQQFKTVWSPANIDPVFNIPNTILQTSPKIEQLVLEMGIEFPGEMDFYIWLAQPRTGIVTNIYWTHTQFFGDIHGVAHEKGKLVEGLPQTGYAVLNYDDKNVRALADRTKAKIMWYGKSPNADIRSRNIQFTDELTTRFEVQVGKKQEEIELQLLGQQFVSLALAAIAVGTINGMDLKVIKQGLEAVKPQPHRMVPIRLSDGSIVIDDTYNANPLATIEALRLLSDVAKDRRKIVVFGEMKELGLYEEAGHREVGVLAGSIDVNYILSLGEATDYTLQEALKNGVRKGNTFLGTSKDEIVERLYSIRRPGDIILVKGSRSMKMEEIVEQIII